MPEFNTETLSVEVDDPIFIEFMCEDNATKRLELSRKLQKKYYATLRYELKTDIGPGMLPIHRMEASRKDTPFAIVAAMGLSSHVETLLTDVFTTITALDEYGETLINTGFEKKGLNTKSLAACLRKEVNQFKISIDNDKQDACVKFRTISGAGNKDEASKNISKLLKQGHKSMGNDRNWSDCIAHLCLALTGIGLLTMIGNKLYSGQFFLNNTSRQVKLDDVKEALHNIDIISKKT